jgi:hypothetical protein
VFQINKFINLILFHLPHKYQMQQWLFSSHHILQSRIHCFCLELLVIP